MQQINQAGISLRKLDNQAIDTGQNLLQAHFTSHETADLLQEPKLLFGAGELGLEVFSAGHRVSTRSIIPKTRGRIARNHFTPQQY